jgi:thiamine-monophosphate kinase
LKAFARGFGADAKAYDCPLLGGDTVYTPGPVTISITAFGTLPKATMVKRSGARRGDHIIVTGTIGDATLGLTLRKQRGAAKRWKLDAAMRRHLLARYLVPNPRNALAEALRRNASAAMDVSDGLVGDLGKLCRASGVGAEVDVARVPLSKAALAVLVADPRATETMLTGGDDFEVVATVPPRKLKSFLAAARRAGVPATGIGRVTAGRGTRFLGPDGRPLRFARTSFSHF